MNFLVDAQLPRRLVFRLREAGHDAVHTLDMHHFQPHDGYRSAPNQDHERRP